VSVATPGGRLRAEMRDLAEVVLVPALAAVLPWSIAYRILRRLAAGRFLYAEPNQRALAEAQRLGWVGDPADWLLRRNLTTAVDHADHYLARTRSDAWMARHLDVQGAWPAPGQPAFLFTFHWGAGMWGLRHAGASGLQVNALVAPVDGAHFHGRAILHRYIIARTRSVALALRRPFIDVSAGFREVLRALGRNEPVLAVIDVPPDQVATSVPIRVLDLPARLPTALLRLAVERKIPVYLYATGFHLASGQRFLRIRALGVPEDVSRLAAKLASALDALIREDPPSWHFWSEAERFFRE
jgi:lauroyl/myristoyl acyltransferase